MSRLEKPEPLHKLHWHRCYSCEDMLVCACGDRRQNDRATGKERRIYCFGCAELQKMLAMELETPVTLERSEGHADKVH